MENVLVNQKCSEKSTLTYGEGGLGATVGTGGQQYDLCLGAALA